MHLYLKTEHSTDKEAEAPAIVPTSHLIRRGQSLVIGRDAHHADIVIPHDNAVSGTHFRVTCGPDGCELQDLESRSGTLVNGQPIKQGVLSDGDHIAAGESRFLVKLVQADGPSAQERPSAAMSPPKPSALSRCSFTREIT